MYYYQQRGDYIHKYEVSYDKSKLKEIKEKIKKECTNTIHHSYILDEDNYQKELERSKTETGLNYQNFRSSKNINGTYTVEYDEYPKMEIISIIDEMLEGKTCILPDLVRFADNQPLKYNSIDISKQLGEVLDSLFYNPTLSQVITARNMKDNYDNAVKYEKRAEEQKKILEKYLGQIQALLKLTLVKSMKLDDIIKVLDFIEDIKLDNMDANIENEKIKIMIKQKGENNGK